MLAGCGELLGADDYASAAPELPYHGFFDRLGGATCRECMQDRCQAPLAECQADPACAEYLDCYTTKPGMRLGCRPPVSFELIDLGAAVANCWRQCTDECNAGRIWSCNRAFDALAPVPGHDGAKCLVKYVDAVSGKPLAGLDVRACRRDDTGCKAPQSATASTDETGRATLEVTWPPPSPISPKPGFDGYLEVTSKTVQPPWWPLLRFTGRREIGDWSDPAVLFNGNAPEVKLALLAAGVQLDTSLSGFAVEIVDCLGVPAPGIRFEVTIEPGGKSVPLVYMDATGTLDPSLTATSASGIAFAANLLGESGEAVGRFADSGLVASQTRFVLRTGATHSVVLQPEPESE